MISLWLCFTLIIVSSNSSILWSSSSTLYLIVDWIGKVGEVENDIYLTEVVSTLKQISAVTFSELQFTRNFWTPEFFLIFYAYVSFKYQKYTTLKQAGVLNISISHPVDFLYKIRMTIFFYIPNEKAGLVKKIRGS